MTLLSTDKCKDTLKKGWITIEQIRDIIRSITNNSDNYDEQYLKIKFNSDDDLPLINARTS